MLICIDSEIALRGARRVQQNLPKRGLEPEISVCCVSEISVKFFGHGLCPHGAGDCVSKGRADVVGGEVDTGDHGNIWTGLATSPARRVGKRTFVLSGSLDACLSWVGKEPARYTQKNLRADNAIVRGPAIAAAVMNQKAESYHEEAGTKDNERLEAAESENHQAQEDAGDHRGKAKHLC